MKPWFKHYNNASTSKTLMHLEHVFGVHKGYSLYFRLVELCHSKWDGTRNPNFIFSTQALPGLIRSSSRVVTQLLLELNSIGHIDYTQSKHETNINFYKLLKIQDKDSKYNRKRIAPCESTTTLDKEIDKEKDKKNKRKRNLVLLTALQKQIQVSVHNLITSHYINNVGRISGVGKLIGTINLKTNQNMKLIKTEEDLKLLEQALKNYRKYLKSEDKEKYPMNIANWVEQWEDWITYKAKNDVSSAW